MIIAHFKNTPIANAPEAVSEVINKYTEHKSYVLGYSYSGVGLKADTDIVHQHNLNNFNFKNKVIQYHSEPFRVDLNVNIRKMVIAQYHATLPEYKNCLIVRNPIDLYNPVFFPKYNNKKIRIGYSPSTLVPQSIWADKGYHETIPILNEIKEIFKDKIEIDLITNVPLPECLRRKSMCNIFIDEVKTDSYHRSGLEGLGMGIATICSVSADVEKVFLKSAQADKNPFINVYHQNLKNKLIELINSGLDNLMEIGYNNRLWMEKYWHPSTIANEYIKIYEQ
jgi:hypothetical protein